MPLSGRAMHIPVLELKDRLSELLRRAEAGEEILVISHGKPLARLEPIERPAGEASAGVRRPLERIGCGRGHGCADPPRSWGSRDPAASGLARLVEDRRHQGIAEDIALIAPGGQQPRRSGNEGLFLGQHQHGGGAQDGEPLAPGFARPPAAGGPARCCCAPLDRRRGSTVHRRAPIPDPGR